MINFDESRFFNFKFNIDGIPLEFKIGGKDKVEALTSLRTLLGKVIFDINVELDGSNKKTLENNNK